MQPCPPFSFKVICQLTLEMTKFCGVSGLQSTGKYLFILYVFDH